MGKYNEYKDLVSVCIPTFNGAKFLQEALDSIKNQTYKNIEVIISDDDSNDDTLSIVETYKEKVEFPVYIYNHIPNGIGANWNNCLRKANGDFIKFLFQDDVLYDNCIEELLFHFNKNKELGLIGCKRNFIVEGKPSHTIKDWIKKYGNLQSQFEKNEHITYLDYSLFKRKDFLESPLNKIGEPTTVMFKKDILSEVGYFDENLKQILDYVFYYKILKEYPIAIVNKPLVAFRIHETQATNINRNKPIKDYGIYDKIILRDFYEYLHPITQKRLSKKYSIVNIIKKKTIRVFRKIKQKIIYYYHNL